MSSLSPKDRVSLCMFSFADGRRCRTPRIRNHPYFCYYHAEKEARARAVQSLGTDLARYFSGNYLSACDLSTALGCLIPAVIRGDVKPKVARTVAYMAQTLLQSIHISQDEHINAFGTDGWRKSIRNSVNGNHSYRFPPAPHRSGGLQAGSVLQPPPASPQTQAQQPPSQPAETPVNCHSARPDLVGERSEESAFSSSHTQPTPAPQPAPPPPTPLPPTRTEFAQQVVARLRTGGGQDPQPQLAPASSPTSASAAPQTPVSQAAPPGTACHPERGEGSQPNHPASTTAETYSAPATQAAQSPAAITLPNHSPRPSSGPSRDTPWWNFGDSGNVPPDSHLL
jgi:hypothetical protein